MQATDYPQATPAGNPASDRSRELYAKLDKAAKRDASERVEADEGSGAMTLYGCWAHTDHDDPSTEYLEPVSFPDYAVRAYIEASRGALHPMNSLAAAYTDDVADALTPIGATVEPFDTGVVHGPAKPDGVDRVRIARRGLVLAILNHPQLTEYSRQRYLEELRELDRKLQPDPDAWTL